MSFDMNVAKQVGTDAAIILNNIEFWQAKNKANGHNFHDGKYWTYNSMKAWEKLFPYLTKDKIRRYLEKLEALGYISTGRYNESAYDRTKWYSSNRQIDLADSPNEIGESPRPIPDINTDINTDIKQKDTIVSKKTPQEKLDERKAEFKERVREAGVNHSPDMLRAFFDYWTEHNDNGYVMRFEKENTFNTKRRLAKWKSNDDKFKKTNGPEKKPSRTHTSSGIRFGII